MLKKQLLSIGAFTILGEKTMKWRLKIFTISLLVGFNALSLANNSETLIYATEVQNYDVIEIVNLKESKKVVIIDRTYDICKNKFHNSAECDKPKFLNRFREFLKKFPD
ncbi:hypothetical protein WH390_03935 [Candidatus Arsenophonus nilaparvatae]|uniref:hypothetical protein n=2 Tax=Candidatus Arsenophonus nilaparvatae TaxID=1247023 RepID=UPI0038782BD6